MDIRGIFDLFLHLDKHLADLTTQYGALTYGILFAIVFAETGLVVTPFLPGDSLLFAAGALAALPNGGLRFELLFMLFIAAAFLGDNVNYFAGKFLGRRVFRESSKILRPEHLAKTEAFFARHGGKALIMARFVPVVRTFMPFVAGTGAMTYGRFLAYSIGGALLWVGICLTAGYFVGNIPLVKKNFSLVVLAVVAISLLPAVVEIIRHRREKSANLATNPNG